MNKTTVCPLDCYDACRITADENGHIKGDKTHPVTQGYLCPNLNHYDQYPRIEAPRLGGREIGMDEALKVLAERLKNTAADSLLYYRGSGNIALMQRSVEHFFARLNAIGTRGSLCDGAGEAGVLAGRGANYPLSPQMIEKSEVVVIWGRNPHVTQSHLLPFLKEKTIIVIDPVKTKMAESADLHVQIRPRGDIYLALLLSRFAMIEGLHDVAYLEEHAPEFHDFYELTQTIRIKATLEQIDVTLGQVGAMLELMKGKKTVILVGAGVQKYRNGADVLRAIDGLGVILSLFGKEGCGVSYLGNSLQDLHLPFESIKRSVPKPTVDFSKYGCVFVQGGNPLAQLPDSVKVAENFAKSGFKVYFGLYENETSRECDLVIPAQSFLEKEDIRSSYGDFTLQRMRKLQVAESGISEYSLASFLCGAFGFDILSEEECFEMLLSQIKEVDGVEYKAIYPMIPYEEGFKTRSGEFEFLEELDTEGRGDNDRFLITPKAPQSLNSQFKRSNGVYLHPECGFEEGEWVMVSSITGSVPLEVKHDDRLRHDCVVIYSGTPGVNNLTPSLLSYEGESAAYQENKVKVEKC